MPRPARVPAYCLHKPSGQARVILDGRHVYLGPYGSAESREKYSRLMWGRFAIGAKPDEPPRDNENPCASLSVNELFVQYLRYATGYYVKDGKPTRELSNIKDAMRAVRALYGHFVASSFGPKSLKAVREYMIESQDLSRKVVNSRVDRIRRIFKWAASEELVLASVYEALRTLSGLRFGRCRASSASPATSLKCAGPTPAFPVLQPSRPR